MHSTSRQQFKELFHAAVELAPSARDAFLNANCVADDDLRSELSALLCAHESAGDFIQQPALVDVGLVADEESNRSAAVAGQQIGSYQIIRELGRGGMGTVYLAARADESFDKQVALKLIKRGMDSDAIIKRFVMERQILANLDHPNIARLIDGGTTADGLPYFVLEYVEGTTITRYCDRHKLNTTERLKLFRQVCAAVQFAHQNLIVHRDLKPSNIIVTEDGTPKLLDFGIAKLLSEAATVEATATISRVLTPEYASPEELLGLSVTTSSDVYSLGVVLYELLSGHRPFNFESRSPEDVARMITASPPIKPSVVITRVDAPRPTDDEYVRATPESISRTRDGTVEKLRRRLAGDLDNILLKALRKEPERRYASVQEFSEDIRRHLERLPVLARSDSLSYRTSKFITRHKAGVAAVLIVALTLLSATIITGWQARVARQERDKSERRFGEVRKLAHAVLFKYHDGIEKLPGSTPVRQMLVQDALEYLDNLSKESGNDAGLQREIAAAYQKVGDVQGNPSSGNLGDLTGALESYQKALAIREKFALIPPGNATDRRDLAVTYTARGDVFTSKLELDRATASFHKAIALDEGIVSADRNDSEAQRNLWMCYRKLGYATALGGELNGALNFFRKAREINELVLAADPTSPQVRKDLATTHTSMGEVTAELRDMAGALESFRKAIAIDQELLATDPANSDNQLDVATDYLNIGEATYYSGDARNALENYRKAIQIFKSVELDDPRNARAKFQVAVGYQRIGGMLAKTGNESEAVETYRKAVRALDDLVQRDPANRRSRVKLADTLTSLGILLAKSDDSAGALEAGRRSLAIAEELSAANPSSPEFNVIVATACSGLGSSHATFAVDSRRSAAMRLAEWREARKWFQKSMDMWANVTAGGRFTSIIYGSSKQVQQDIARCDAALAKLGG
jgi:non-specific serine/threonine protein kinase/serine/threonine-protein kinase